MVVANVLCPALVLSASQTAMKKSGDQILHRIAEEVERGQIIILTDEDGETKGFRRAGPDTVKTVCNRHIESRIPRLDDFGKRNRALMGQTLRLCVPCQNATKRELMGITRSLVWFSGGAW